MHNTTAEQINLQIGRNIRTARLLQGRTQADVSSSMNPPLSAQQVLKYESGADRLRVDQLVQLMAILGLTPAQIFKGIAEHLPKGDAPSLSLSPNEGRILTNYRDINSEPVREMIYDIVRVCAMHVSSSLTTSKA